MARAKSRSSGKAKPAARAKSATKAKPAAKAKPTKTKPVAKAKAAAETARTRARTVSQSEETARTRAPTATDVRSQTRRARAPTVSERTETPRTRAPTIRRGTPPAGVGAVMKAVRDAQRDAPVANRARTRSETLVFDRDRPPGRTRSETLVFDRDRAPARPRSETMIDAPLTVIADDDLTGASGDGDAARAAELSSLEERIVQLDDPDVLVAIATQVDTLGMQLAFEISRHAHDAAYVAPLKPVLMRVPMIYGRALVRAAEKFDDLGSPKRAAYVLFEALRKAFDPEVIASVASALSFILDAHGQGTAAQRLSDLVAIREEQRAAGMDRKEVRAQFSAALEQLRDRGVDWPALADDSPQFD